MRAVTTKASELRLASAEYSRAAGKAFADHPVSELLPEAGRIYANPGGEVLAKAPAWLQRVWAGTKWHRAEQSRLALEGDGVAELYVAKAVRVDRRTGLPKIDEGTGEALRGRGSNRVDYYEEDVRILSMKHTQLSEVKVSTVENYLRELVTKYPPGTPIKDVPSTPADLVGKRLDGEMVLYVPKQVEPVSSEIVKLAEKYDVTIVEGLPK